MQIEQAPPETPVAATVEKPVAPSTTTPVPLADGSVPNPAKKKPVVCILIGMAGSGKTTLMQRINAELRQRHKKGYIINLDPAVTYMPYKPNIDIRETVNYKEVMKQYGLGPNGGILTSLNLFATRFDQVLGFLEKRQDKLDYIFLDTPGQIEVFTWSVANRTRPFCSFWHDPASFGASIMYKTKLPMIVLFNKIDIQPHETLLRWMADLECFQEALRQDESYSTNLTHSMALVLDEFYANLSRVGVSATTGQGIPQFFELLAGAEREYAEFYLPHREAALQRKVWLAAFPDHPTCPVSVVQAKLEEERQAREMAKVRKEMAGVAISERQSQPPAAEDLLRVRRRRHDDEDDEDADGREARYRREDEDEDAFYADGQEDDGEETAEGEEWMIQGGDRYPDRPLVAESAEEDECEVTFQGRTRERPAAPPAQDSSASSAPSKPAQEFQQFMRSMLH
ncbi:putative GPN-loop GTPase 1 [Paratrimastix pyriformis]|uniref:GPN-loop GTPase 1 n=1 Tax=Paratrimastix pyriformis TaxID=342808 RepID=A0ABQ8UQP3_9EUKA|nr:putative GPN-loop GTPase 1 [Paratrimastix pyriformis]